MTDRRSFLRLLGAGAAGASLTPSITRALQIPAHHRTGSIDDIEHIVFLMQENRSFDHYFGTLRGVRGFGDPRAVTLPSGKPVWNQPNGAGQVLPFHPTAAHLGLTFIEDLAHDWATTHDAWNGGRYDQWVPQKGTTTMVYLTRNDIPFHYALADAFTVCDAYYCSLLGPTDPNRYHMWTGWVGNDGKGGGPVLDNAEAGYGWSTYPERLTKAAVSWKVYQDTGEGLDAPHFWGWTGDNAYIGNYGDNSLLYFHQYQNAAPGSPLHQAALTGTTLTAGGTLFDVFKSDVLAGNLPKVSWIVAPEAYTEHPNWPANYGAWYVSQILDALTANPAVWSKTAFFLMYDENDGFFDHMVPPTPPQSRAQGLSTVATTNEVFAGNSGFSAGPIGLGVRVPMVVISPWSKGGWVDSQVFDHTSLLRFIEQRFGPHYPGLTETNITPWRRAVCGDLTSAFDFQKPNATVVSLPGTVSYVPPDNTTHPDYKPAVPTVQSVPSQEPGVRPARALPYELHAHASADPTSGIVTLQFRNTGKATAVFQVRAGGTTFAPRTYTVGPRSELADTWNYGSAGTSDYDLAVYGPNGFLRAFSGSVAGRHSVNLSTRVFYDALFNGLTLEIRNNSAAMAHLQVSDAYSKATYSPQIKPGQVVLRFWQLGGSHGWYDLTITSQEDAGFEQQFAGHLETGEDSYSDPQLGASNFS